MVLYMECDMPGVSFHYFYMPVVFYNNIQFTFVSIPKQV